MQHFAWLKVEGCDAGAASAQLASVAKAMVCTRELVLDSPVGKSANLVIGNTLQAKVGVFASAAKAVSHDRFAIPEAVGLARGGDRQEGFEWEYGMPDDEITHAQLMDASEQRSRCLG